MNAWTKLREKTYRLLRKSQKYTKTDMVYLAKGGSWLTFSQIVSSLSSFLLTIAFANLLPKETFGVYKYVLSIAAILTIPSLPGMISAVIRAVARGNDGVYVQAVKTQMKWGLLGGIAGLAIALYYFLNGNTELTIAFLIVAAVSPIMSPLTTYTAYLSGKAAFKGQAIYNALTQIGMVAGVIATLFFTKNILLIIFAYFFLNTFLSFIFTILTKWHFPPRKESAEETSSTLSFGKHLSVMSIINVIAKNADNIILWHFLGPAEVAIYALAYIPVKQMNQIFSKIAQPLVQPKFSRNSMMKLQQTLPKKVLLLVAAAILITIAYFFVAPFIYAIVFPEYLASVPYTKLAILSAIGIPFTILNFALIGQLKQKELYIQKLSSRSISLVGMVVLTYYFGIWGMVGAQVLSSFLNAGTNYVLFQRSRA